MKKSIAASIAVVLLSAFIASDVYARGGRGGPGPGRGGAGPGGRVGRTGPGVTRGRIGRNNNANGRTAKEWELLRDEENRAALIDERRNALMEEDRFASQEDWLAGQRLRAADRESRTGDVR